MAVIGGILIALIVAWRIYKLLEMIWTREGIIGLFFLLDMLLDPVVVLFDREINRMLIFLFCTLPFWVGIFLSIAYYWKKFRTLSSFTTDFYNRLPQKRINPSKGIIVGGLVVYIILALLLYGFALLYTGFAYRITSFFMSYIVMIGVFAVLSIIYKPCRVSMAMLANVALLGLLAYRIDAGSSGMGVDSSDAVAAGPDVIDTSSVNGDVSNVSVDPTMTSSPIDNSGFGTSPDTSTNMNSIDNLTPSDGSSLSSYTISQTDSQGVVPAFQAATIQDANGDTIGQVNPISDTSATVTDTNGMYQGSMTQNNLTGDVMLNDASGLTLASVTSSGIVQGVDGLTDGRLIHMENGATIIQNSVGQTLAYVNQNGVITGTDGMTLGRIKS